MALLLAGAAVSAYTEEERKQYEEYCKTNNCNAYDDSNPPPQPTDAEMTMNCVEGVVIPECEGAKYIMTKNNKVTKYKDGTLKWYNTCFAVDAIPDTPECVIANSWYLFESAIKMALFLLDYGMETLAAGLTENQVLGVNALRCAMTNGLVNGADLLAALFLVAKQFTLDPLLQEYTLDYIYPYYCTCQQDVRNLKDMLRTAASFGVEVKPVEFPPCNST
jgi:hypothetical protein